LKSKTPILEPAAAAIEADKKMSIEITALYIPVLIFMKSPSQSNE
jgi:hypothetical protein